SFEESLRRPRGPSSRLGEPRRADVAKPLTLTSDRVLSQHLPSAAPDCRSSPAAESFMHRFGTQPSPDRRFQEWSALWMCAEPSRTGPRASCEHAFVMFADALLLLFEMADREDERFQTAAARWHARFVLEAGLPLREAENVMTLLGRLRAADRLVVRR